MTSGPTFPAPAQIRARADVVASSGKRMILLGGIGTHVLIDVDILVVLVGGGTARVFGRGLCRGRGVGGRVVVEGRRVVDGGAPVVPGTPGGRTDDGVLKQFPVVLSGRRVVGGSLGGIGGAGGFFVVAPTTPTRHHCTMTFLLLTRQ